jgi:hypothetical protein
MTKRPKKSRKAKPKKAVARVVESKADEALPVPADQSLVELAKAEVRAQLELIGEQREANVEFDKDLALGTAALMRSLIAAESEDRQRRKAETKSLSEFHLDQIIEHLRTRIPSDEIEDFVKKLTGADREESLL